MKRLRQLAAGECSGVGGGVNDTANGRANGHVKGRVKVRVNGPVNSPVNSPVNGPVNGSVNGKSDSPSVGGPLRGAPGEVRIIGGQWKRSKLPVIARQGLRPTPDRVRQRLFDWLGQDLHGWRVIDAFAGSGALGLEAASRGAAQVLLIESDPALAHSLRSSALRLKATAVKVVCSDALATLRAQGPLQWDLVMLDPPYNSNLLQPALEAAAALLAPSGCIYAEDAQALPAPPPGWQVVRQGRAGRVHHHLLRRTGDETGGR